MMIQDMFRNEPWKMLTACVLLNQTSGDAVKGMIRKFFEKHFEYNLLARTSLEELAADISEVGLQNKKAKVLQELGRKANTIVKVDDIEFVNGLGDYARESWSVFIDRRWTIDAKDKEIRKYLKLCVPSNILKQEVARKIQNQGEEISIRGESYIEVTKFEYSFDDNTFCKPPDSDAGYVYRKMIEIDPDVKVAIAALKRDLRSRQAVVCFDQIQPLPNCVISAQMMVRKNKLLIIVHQRSQDIEMLEKDCDIISRMACKACGELPVDGYEVTVLVGSMHAHLNKSGESNDQR